MADAVTWVFRFIHILAGVMWVGGIYLWGMVIAPSVTRRAPPQIRGPFMREVLPRITRYFTIAGITTILSGLVVMGLIVPGRFGGIADAFAGKTVSAGYGSSLGAAFVLAIAMIVIAIAYIQPAATRLLDWMAKAPAPTPGTPPGPPPPEVLAITRKLMIGGMVNLLLGTIVLGLMAWAVNLRS